MDGATAPHAGANPPAPPPGERPTLHGLLGSLADASGARVRLFEAEFKRAAWSSATMAAMGVAAALLLITAWLIFAASLVYATVSAGMPWWLGAVIVIAAHLAGAFVLLQRVRGYVERLSFSATRRAVISVFRSGPSA